MCSTLWLLIGHSRQVGAAPPPPAAGRSYAEHKDPAQRVNCKIKKPLPPAHIKLGINLIFITAAEMHNSQGVCAHKNECTYIGTSAAGRRATPQEPGGAGRRDSISAGPVGWWPITQNQYLKCPPLALSVLRQTQTLSLTAISSSLVRGQKENCLFLAGIGSRSAKIWR